MDKQLIERLALEAGFDPLTEMALSTDDPELDFAFVNNEYCVGEELLRFAALVAEECAKISENVIVPFARDDGEDRAAAAIRERFKP